MRGMKLLEKLLDGNVSPAVAATKLGQSLAVQDSMPFAIYSFLFNHSSFEDCLHCAIMHGGDRDTLGAMAGAVSGAYLGLGGVPPEWRSKLENVTTIENLALELLRKRVSSKD